MVYPSAAIRLLFSWLWLVILLFMGCGRTDLEQAGGVPTPEPEGVEIVDQEREPVAMPIALRVLPSSIRLPLDGEQSVLVEAVFDDGTSEDVSEEALASVDRPELVRYEAGRVTALKAGQAQLMLTYHDVSARLSVTVESRKIVHLSITPSQGVMEPGGRLNFQAQGLFDDGTSAEVTQVVGWSTSDELVARVSNAPSREGQAQGIKVGRVEVIARAGDVEASVPLSVTESARLASLALWPSDVKLLPGTSRVVELFGVYSDGGLEPLTEGVSWEVDPPELAQVMLAQDGWRISAQGIGTGRFSATYQGMTVSGLVEVLDAQVSALELSPPSASVAALGQVRLVAQAWLDDGRLLDASELVSWSTSQIQLASVDREGLVFALKPGVVTITAALGALSAQAKVTVTTAQLVALAVEPVDPLLPLGVRVPFYAMGTFDDGSIAQVTHAATWSSSWPTVGRITEGGALSTHQEGVTVVTARLGQLSANASVTVAADALISLEVDPSALTFGPGERGVLRAFGTLRSGLEMELTEGVSWSSSAAEVVGVSNVDGQRGVVRALKPGGAMIRAQLGALSATAQLLVEERRAVSLEISPGQLKLPRGTSFPLEVTAKFADGSERNVTDQSIWRTSDQLLLDVLNTPGFEGRVMARSPGIATVTARFRGLETSLSVEVTDATIVSIELTPADPVFQIGDEGQFSATGIFSDGSSVYITREARWSVGDEDIARAQNAPDREGFIRALSPGVTTARARFDGVVGQTTLTVKGGQLSQLVLTPRELVTPTGVSHQLQLQAIYDDGSVRHVTSAATYESGDVSIARVDGRGLVQTLSAGQTSLTARFMGATAVASLTVTQAELVEVQVTPVDVEVAVDSLLKFWATAIYSDGTRQDVTEGVDWSTSDPNVMTVTINYRWPGIGRAQGPGQAQIKASLKGVEGVAQVRVTEAQLLDVKLTPIDSNVAPGTQMQYFAQAIFDDGSSRDVTFLSTWWAEVDPVVDVRDGWEEKGKAIARREGTSKVYALYQGVRGEATVTVSAATVTHVQVVPFTPTINAGDELRFFATAVFSDGTTQQVSQDVIWQSDDTNVVTVSNARWYEGLATTHRAGSARILARYQGVQGSTTLTVTGLQIAQVQVTPFIETIPQGYYLRMLATAIYLDGSSRDITELATWTSSAPQVADVHASFWVKGWAKGISPGQTFVQASYQGVSGSARLDVTDATLTSINLIADVTQIRPAEVAKFEAEGVFSDGSVWDVTHYLTWSSSSPSVADVSNAWISRGEATGFMPGMTTIKAGHAGVEGAMGLTVLP